LCQEDVKSPTSAKTSRLKSQAHCDVQRYTSCAEAFMMVQKSSNAPACCILWRRTFLADFPCKRKKQTVAAKQQQQKLKQQ